MFSLPYAGLWIEIDGRLIFEILLAMACAGIIKES